MKHIIIISMIMVSLLIILSLTGCYDSQLIRSDERGEGPEEGKSPRVLEFVSLSRGIEGTLKNKAQYVLRNEEEFKEIWQNISPVRELPEIDFESNMVVAVFMGEKPTGGYEIEIKTVYEYEDKIVLNMLETEPGEEDMVTQALTYPYHTIILEISEKDVMFEVIE